ncbi:MAG TPA: (Fe-S)-binding protein [Gaiellales bacterium]|nr:(Fe-S)-binding protein [Gaiellales bacterium]
MTQTTRELLDACVHCGFCLPACPTYALWGEEMDSPRGRIHLMNLVESGQAAMDGSVATHLDRCLGCLACVPACPSGVRYDLLIERARGERRREAPLGLRARAVDAAVFAVVPRPRLLRALSWPLALGVRPSALAPRVSAADLRASPPPFTAASAGAARMRVALLSGCAQRVFFGRVNAAAVAALSAAGCDVSVPAGQGCCGALDLHAGRDREARRRAAQTAKALAGYDRVVVTAAGCGSAMKGYGELLGTADAEAFAGRVCDVTELLAELGGVPAPPPAARPLRVVYQDACHLRHGQGVVGQPRTLLRSVPGVELVEIADPGMCCGSAGTYNLMQPAAARRLGERKARAILDAEPDVVATANPGCALQLAASLRRLGRGDLRIVHPVELLVSEPA